MARGHAGTSPGDRLQLDDKVASKVVAALTGFGLAGEVWKDPERNPDDPQATDLEEIASGDCLPLYIEAQGTKPEPGTYTGILVITSGGGGEARRKVVLTVGGAQGVEVAADPARILTKPLKDFSVGGVNFFPSLLNPSGTAAFGAGWLLLFICLPFAVIKFAVPKHKRWLLAVAAVLVFLLLVGGADDAVDNGAFFDGSGGDAVVMSTPLVDSTAAKGAVGSLVGKDGVVAMAVVKPDDANEGNFELDVEGIPRAGAYDGKIDLLPDTEGGDATVTANVRDYWAIAFFVIGLGVLLGYWVNRYFTLVRGNVRLEDDANELRREVERASRALEETNGELHTTYSIEPRMEKRLRQVEGQLALKDKTETEKATEELKAAQLYFQTVLEMWTPLTALPGAADEVAEELKRRKFCIDPYTVPAVRRARSLVETRFDDGGLDAASTDLNARKKEIDETLALLEELKCSLPDAASIRDHAKAVPGEDRDDECELTVLGTHRDALRKAISELIAASSVDDARKAMSAVVSEGEQICELAAPVERPEGLFAARAIERETPAGGAALDLGPSAATPEAQIPAPSFTPARGPSPRRLALLDRRMTVAAGLLAVFSGLLTLYVTSPTWGAPGDYLKAFLWGSVVSEGTKAVIGLVARTGPTA